jgi:putative DNA primase/helicase
MADRSMTFSPREVSAYYAARVPKLRQVGAEWRGPCPIHNGTRDSFAVEPRTGRWCCFSDCGRGGDVIELEMALGSADFKTAKVEVFRIIGRADAPAKTRARVAATYDYRDEAGHLLFQSVRMDPKDFRQRRPNDTGGWIWNLKGVRLVPYRLPELVKRTTENIFVCEGERDVETLEGLGLLATCNPMGAGKWRAEYSDVLRERSVVILPDNDGPGRAHAVTVCADLLRVGCEVRIVEVPEGKDVSEWLGAGGTLAELQALAIGQPTLTVEALAALPERWGLNAETETPRDERPIRTNGGPESSAFRLTNEGVLYCDPDPDKEPLTICGRLEIAAVTRDAKGDGWGRLLRWNDPEGRAHEWALPMSLLAGDGNEYRGRLLDGGLYLAPSRKAREKLTVYLQTVRPETRALCVARVGWHADSFILPGATIGPRGSETVLFQTPFDTEHYLNVSGTADEWRDKVGRLCSGNSRLILAVSCAFAGPLLSLVGGESGGIHFIGATSTGKSTALLVGGSVLGGGGRNGFVQSWRSTANGLEAIAELHNDLTLFLDELAQMDAREAADTAYLLGNGSGKTRMSRNIGARKKLSWSLLFVSAGEVTLADHAQTAGKRTKGGAEVRLLNIEADAGTGLGLFEKIHRAESADAFARQLKDAAKRFYGSPLRTYLDSIAGTRAAVEKWVLSFQAEFVGRHVPPGASGEVLRAAQRFALIAAAGRLATDAGITGWEQSEAESAAALCLQSWIACRGTTGAGDAEAAVNQVRRFIEANGASRFQTLRHCAIDSSEDNQFVVNRAGFRRQTGNGETEYLVLRETFKTDVCVGFDYRLVARVLSDRGFLDCQPPDLTKRVRLPGNLGLIRAFCIKASILEG